MISSSKNYIQIIFVIVLLAGNVFFGGKYILSQKEFNQEKVVLENQKLNEDILNFTKLFIEKVLKTETEVDFETRLMLENAVRNLNDKDILKQWQEFVASQDENEAQEKVKDLLSILINKIKIEPIN
ncbi:MAG: hypothetical protein PHX25_00120 [Candidatus Pacebacteria bacterium]|nr:hypothetical protein [Candidatus Paceibacterota bacterium]